jgi:hypothetical protein
VPGIGRRQAGGLHQAPAGATCETLGTLLLAMPCFVGRFEIGFLGQGGKSCLHVSWNDMASAQLRVAYIPSRGRWSHVVLAVIAETGAIGHLAENNNRASLKHTDDSSSPATSERSVHPPGSIDRLAAVVRLFNKNNGASL